MRTAKAARQIELPVRLIRHSVASTQAQAAPRSSARLQIEFYRLIALAYGVLVMLGVATISIIALSPA
ncbi:MAG: hypothetical protein ACRCUE_10830 [Bosea sp. (in: a-proteobacteria)]